MFEWVKVMSADGRTVIAYCLRQGKPMTRSTR